MKKLWKVFAVTATLAFLNGCQTPQEDVPVAMPTETVTPTIKVPEADVPEETVVPTEAIPTVEPTATVAPQETLTPVPTVTQAVEPTVEPTATSTPVPTATPTPTEVPHEHTWTVKETPATCTTEGTTVEVCECGEQQNLTTIPALGHTVEKKVTKEATVEEEGTWEEVCTVCHEVVNTGTIEKLEPTPTPEPTSTPTPTPSPKPTKKPEPTATPKPTATPTPTPSPKPTSIPTPTPMSEKPYLRFKDSKERTGTFTIGSINPVIFELELVNYSENYDATNLFAKIKPCLEILVSDESIVTCSAQEYRNEEKGTIRPTFTVTPLSTGTVEITVILNDMDTSKGWRDYWEVVKETDRITFTLEVKGNDSKVDFTEYNPLDHGYVRQIGEWQVGDNIYASLWWDNENKSDVENQLVLFTGTGATWDNRKLIELFPDEYSVHSVGTAPWLDYDVNPLVGLGESVFTYYFCEGITKISNMSDDDTMKRFDFSGSRIQNLYLPSTLTHIGHYALIGYVGEELILPKGVEFIGHRAFAYNDNLKSLVLPEKLKYLGGCAFSGYSQTKNQLTEIRIPKSIEYMGYSVFNNRLGSVVILPKSVDTSKFHEQWLGFTGGAYKQEVKYE